MCILEEGDCPEACEGVVKKAEDKKQDETKDNEKKTSGKLVVTNEENDSVVITDAYDSILDTITFKTDEEVTIDSITLERIGLSTYKSIDKVWLESEDGVKVTSEKNVSTKDEVSFTLDKDYRTIDGTQSFVIVVRSQACSGGVCPNVGTSIGFNVKEVTSSAKDYTNKATKGNTYDFKDYSADGVRVENTLSSTKTYNFAEGEMYDVAKIRVNAKDVAIKVSGFTLKNDGNNTIDVADIEDVAVAINGTAIKNVKTTQTKKELTVSFPEQEIAIKGKAVFTLSVSLKSDFEDFGKNFHFIPENSSSFVITEASNNVRVKIATDSEGNFKSTEFDSVCTINGGKIEFEAEKLASSIDIAQGGEGTVAAGTLKVSGQAVETSKMYVVVKPVSAGLTVTGLQTAIESVEFYVGNSSEAEVTTFEVNTTKTALVGTMDSIEIDEDSEISLVVKVDSDAKDDTKGKIFSVSLGTGSDNAAPNISADTMGLKYEATSNSVKTEGKVIGSITISNVRIQAGKATLSNDMTAARVQFNEKDPMEPKTVFEGTYTAKKQDLNLMNVTLVANKVYTGLYTDSDIEFKVYVKGEAVASLTDDDFKVVDGKWTATTDLGQILVKVDDEPTPVKITAAAYAASGSAATPVTQIYTVYFDGEDLNNSPAGEANADCIDIEFVKESAVNLVKNAATKQKDVILSKKNQEVAHFIAKPANKAETAVISSVEITFSGLDVASDDDFSIEIDKDNTYTSDFECTANVCTNNDLNITINGETEIKVIAKKLVTKDVDVTVTVNGTDYASTRTVKDAIVRIVSQKSINDNTETSFTFDVNFSSEVDSETISNVKLFSKDMTVDAASGATAATTGYIYGWDSISDADVKNVPNTVKTEVRSISYVVDGKTIVITKTEAPDFFEINGSAVMVFGDK